MSRSVWKGPFVDAHVLKKAEKARESGRNEVIKIWSRRSTILPQFVGLTFGVYNGKKHIPVNVSEDMIGQKFGEYCADPHLLRACGRQESEAEVSHEQGKEPSPRGGERGDGGQPDAEDQPAEAEPRRRDDPQQAGRRRRSRDLTFSKKRVSDDVKKTLQSAIANAENNHGLDVDELVVAEAFVGKNMVLKRGQPARPRPLRQDPEAVQPGDDQGSAGGSRGDRLMGQKINPIGLRLQVNRTWDSRWFADGAEYGKLLHEDLAIRDFIKKNAAQAGISRVVIERPHRSAG